jgi:O-antigen/teichoic acid export membrane protein
MSLRATAISGAKWTTASSVAVATVQFVQLTVVARLLSPGDFGMMAMVMAVIGFAQIFTDVGIGSAIIQRPENSPAELSSLFWLNVLAGTAVFVLTIAATPLVVLFFDEPRLASLLPTVAVVFVIASFGQQFQLLLQKELEFRKLALIELLSAVGGAVVAISGALAGLGVYALVFGQLGMASLATAAAVTIGWRRWRPRAWFRAADTRPYLRFGLFQLGNRGVNFLLARVDQIVIGALLGASALGLYNLAWNLAIMPATRINPILTRVAFPVFAKVQQQNERLKRGYLMLVWLLATTNGPILVGGAAVADALVPVIFGAQWTAMVPIFQVLAVVGLSRSIGNPIGSLVLAKGRPDLEFKLNLWIVVVQVPAVYLGARLGGIAGVACTVLVLQLADLALSYIFLMRPLIGPCMREYVRCLVVPLATSVCMAVIVLLVPMLLGRHSLLMVLVGQIAVGGIFYVAATIVLQRAKLAPLLDGLLATRS